MKDGLPRLCKDLLGMRGLRRAPPTKTRDVFKLDRRAAPSQSTSELRPSAMKAVPQGLQT